MKKTYHVHVSERPHHDSYSHHPAKSFPCHLKMKEMPKDWKGDSGCKYHVQLNYREGNSESGTTAYYTCSEIRLAFRLIWLRIKGYREDERLW